MIYEFKCEKCKEEFEMEMEAKNYKLPSKCPYCSNKKVKRIYSKISIDFSKGGSGFYKNDY